jgi:hypothetical protein
MSVAEALVTATAAYAAAGGAFAIAFVTIGAGRLDERARGAPPGFRLVIVPGVVALWPFLAWRWLRGATAPPQEWNAHRAAARVDTVGGRE